MRRRRYPRRHDPVFCADVSPAYPYALLGLILTLLIVEMATPMPHHGMLVDSYLSRNAIPMPAAARDDAMRLMIMQDGAMYFGNAKIASSDLPDLIRRCVQSGSSRKIFLLVDAHAKCGDLSIALDEVRRAGIRDVAFLAESPILHK